MPTKREERIEENKDAQPDFRSGDVVTYVPADRFDRWWCREGTAIVRDDGRMVDTYWGSGSENHILGAAEAETAKLMFNVGDFDELTRYAPGNKLKWEMYAPADRGRIPSQHGLQARWFIRKGAVEDLPTKIENARERLEECQSNLRSAQWKVECAERDLAKLTDESAAAIIDASVGFEVPGAH